MMLSISRTNKPLETRIYPSGDIPVIAGKKVKITVTVINQGGKSAFIDISLEQSPNSVRPWFKPSRQSIAIPSDQKGEVKVDFWVEIPPDTIPGDYDYLLTIDAPNDYPEDTPILHPGKFKVSPFVQESRTVTDPKFTIQPLTSSLEPKAVKLGETVEFSVIVHNRSNRVDRFRVSCPDLEDNWNYKIVYPEGINLPGLVTASDGLELNPGEKGDITIYITPPKDALAGIYSPTIRLYSENLDRERQNLEKLDKERQKDNQIELVLLDLIYLQIAPVYQLDVQFETKIGRVKQENGLFELKLHNQGNSIRNLNISAQSAEGDPLCTYQLNTDSLVLFPGQIKTVELTVIPPQSKWKRNFYGRFFNFYVNVEDQDQIPLINSRFQGMLMWEGRPQWQLWLLIFGGLLTIGSLVILILWLLFRPKPIPKIVEFFPESDSYQEVKSERIRLNWEVSQPQHIKNLQIVGLGADGTVLSEAVSYDFSQGLPKSLAEFCTLKRVLICRNVPTDGKKPGDYIFQLTIFPKDPQKDPIILKTNTINIEAAPLPKINLFSSTKPVYYEEKKETITLKFNLAYPEQLKSLELVGKSEDNPDFVFNKIYKLQGNFVNQAELCEQGTKQPCVPIPCEIKQDDGSITCNNIPTNAQTLGNYIFTLTAIPKKAEVEPLEPSQTPPIKIAPIPLEIISFKVNNAEALPNYSFKINPSKPAFLTISWEVKGSSKTKVELLPSPGTVALKDAVTFNLNSTPLKETITLQATDDQGQKISRSFMLETVIEQLPSVDLTTPSVLPPSREIPIFEPSPLPTPSPTTADSSTAGSTPPGGDKSSSQKSSQPPGATPPLPPGQDLPLPAELPPQLH